MKKLFAMVVLVALSLLFSGCVLEEVIMPYSETAETDGLFISVSKIANRAFVGRYDSAEYPDNFEITIPDEYEGVPIKQIGGYHGRGVPSPFCIDLSFYLNAPKESKYDAVFGGDLDKFDIAEDYVIEEILFELNIGENIETVEYVSMDDYYPHINEDGSITFYHPVVNITCSDDNEHFYSKDGKLYHKATDEVVSEFAYASP